MHIGGFRGQKRFFFTFFGHAEAVKLLQKRKNQPQKLLVIVVYRLPTKRLLSAFQFALNAIGIVEINARRQAAQVELKSIALQV